MQSNVGRAKLIPSLAIRRFKLSYSSLRDLLIVLWFLSWTSTPDSEAVLSINSLDGYAITKITYRVLIILIILYLMWIDKAVYLKKNESAIFLPKIFFLVNFALLTLSGNIFYSVYRLFEFLLIWLSAIAFIGNSTSPLDIFERIQRLFLICSLVCFLLIIVYFLLPDWGAKFSGFDDSGEAKLRLGGTLLRVDLVASLGGTVFLFYFYLEKRFRNLFPKIFGMFVGFVIVLLSHSRTVIFILLFLSMISIFLKKARMATLFVTALIVILALGFQEQFLVFVMRGSEISEISELNGRISLWAAAMESNSITSLLIGNGYLMNTPEGLDFYVPEFGRNMNSTHNGYLTVLLGSGIAGIIILMFMYLTLVINLFKKNRVSREYSKPMIIVFAFIAITTIMDYGIWGVTSPSTLIFAVIYIASFINTKRIV